MSYPLRKFGLSPVNPTSNQSFVGLVKCFILFSVSAAATAFLWASLTSTMITFQLTGGVNKNYHSQISKGGGDKTPLKCDKIYGKAIWNLI